MSSNNNTCHSDGPFHLESALSLFTITQRGKTEAEMQYDLPTASKADCIRIRVETRAFFVLSPALSSP